MTNISSIGPFSANMSLSSSSAAAETGSVAEGTFASALKSAASPPVGATPSASDIGGGLFVGYEGPVVALGSGVASAPASPSPASASSSPWASDVSAGGPIAPSLASPPSTQSSRSAMAITSSTSVSGRSVSGAGIVDTAEQYLATPYVWGGSTPAGFDCSGLVQYVFARWGIHLPRTSEQQANVGQAVSSLADARPGDLLFFAGSDGTVSSPGHVAIYAGGDQMIDAPYTGSSVRVEPIPTAGSIVAIRRVVGS